MFGWLCAATCSRQEVSVCSQECSEYVYADQ